VSSLVLEVDGKLFKNSCPSPGDQGVLRSAAQAGGGMAPSAGNGYIMLRPLSRVDSYAQIRRQAPEFSQAVTYTLTWNA
jgi:hypothetical protein